MKLKQKKQLLEQLKTIPDFRVDRHKIKFPLEQILFMTLFALLKGASTFKEIQIWMDYAKNNKILKKVFAVKQINIPSKSTLHRILINIDNNALEIIFRNHFSKYIERKNIAIDGKWLNGSDVNAQYTTQSHQAILNVLDKDAKIVFAHKFLDHTKKSEIPAFTQLLKDKFFTNESQIFSFDALLTQHEILNTINEQKNLYIAKVKGNQKLLKEKIILTANSLKKPRDTYKDNHLDIRERDTRVVRTVEVYQEKDCNLVVYHSDFKNIQSIIKVTKESTDIKTGKIQTSVEYLIANYKASAQEFRDTILQHWRVETYHYHLDMLMDEDDHLAYINPFSISILRSFALNLYQLFVNKYKDEKILFGNKPTMANIAYGCKYDDDLVSELFEL